VTFDVWAPLVLPLLLAPLLALVSVRSLADRLPPRLAAWLLTGTAVVLAGSGAAALGLLALAALLHLPAVAAVGHLELPVARHLAPEAVTPVGLLAGAVLLVLGLRATRALRRHLRDLAGSRRVVSGRPASAAGLVVLPDRTPDAYALPGLRRRHGRIVVTSGMLTALSPAEREVLLAHERAHLNGRHHWFLLLADLAAALHPLLCPLRDGIGYSVERWADEAAAASVADRRLVARAIGRAALAGNSRSGTGPTPPRRAPIRRTLLGLAAGPVPRRVAALLSAPVGRTRRPVLATVLTAALLAAVPAVSLGTALDAARDLHAQVELAQRIGQSQR
jgi:Zn-dependent protease with chaperone function